MGLERVVQKGISFARENRNFVISASFMTLANLADTLITGYAINSGNFSEGMFYMGYYIENYRVNNFSLIKLGLGLCAIPIYYLFKNRTKMAYVSGIGLSGFAAYNSLQLFIYS